MLMNRKKVSPLSENSEVIPDNLVTSNDDSDRIFLEWFNITYSIKQRNRRIKILKGVSGFANPGQILAIMGSSGSGKTSLLSILSNQIFPRRGEKILVKISINGVDIKNVDYSIYSRYVMQESIVLPTLTPREALTYAAKLKIKGNDEFITERVNKVIKDLKLSKIADKFIGNEFIKGLSGGEKKRVCIGLELISEPQILILDEPTSGLDSPTAELIINLMKHQAEKGKTIILTIHQPSSNVFCMFDRLILMSEGQFIYQGCASKSLEYFSKIGYSCPDMTNPPDYFMRILYVRDRHFISNNEIEMLKLFVNSYKINEENVSKEINKTELAEINTQQTIFRAGIVIEISILFERAWKNNLRNPFNVALKFIQSIVTAALVDLVFQDLGYDMKGVQNRQGALFFSAVYFVFIPSQTSSIAFPIERPTFVKDYKEGLYGVTPFLLVKLLTDLPFQIITTFIYVVMIYFALNFNLNSSEQFFVFYGLMLLMHLCGSGYGNFAGVFFPDTLAAIIWGSTIAVPLVMYAGYLSNINSISPTFYWIKFISAYYFGYNALAINEFTDLDLESDVVISPLKSSGISGELWEHAGGLILVIIGCNILTFFALKFYGEKKKFK
ncbi:hypothetical protein SteCoe_121 [Stentor coeruleus]|uniref:ABC transporter domain-containing protein n=1 Tax=Stentor coeruleus TaxID=5963 RepID=A0A1R2D573_9CILI|nr:hypothetical protein SteCoe_121 [Stentor coeruleus]